MPDSIEQRWDQDEIGRFLKNARLLTTAICGLPGVVGSALSWLGSRPGQTARRDPKARRDSREIRVESPRPAHIGAVTLFGRDGAGGGGGGGLGGLWLRAVHEEDQEDEGRVHHGEEAEVVDDAST